MNLKIHNYDILNFETNNIVISEKGVATVNSPSLLEIFKKLQSRKNISEEELLNLFHTYKLDTKEAHTSLQAIIGLREEIGSSYFGNVIVVHDWESECQLKTLIGSELPETTIVYHRLGEKIIATEKTNTFLVMLCTNYDYTKIKKSYFDFSSSNPRSAISVAYTAGDQFIISQPYIPSLGKPCHFCTIDRMIENEAHRPSTNTWSRLLNFCRKNRASLPASKLSLFQQTLIIAAIIQKIKLINTHNDQLRYQDNILQETTTCLSTGRTSETSTAHWSMCDCLRMEI